MLILFQTHVGRKVFHPSMIKVNVQIHHLSYVTSSVRSKWKNKIEDVKRLHHGIRKWVTTRLQHIIYPPMDVLSLYINALEIQGLEMYLSKKDLHASCMQDAYNYKNIHNQKKYKLTLIPFSTITLYLQLMKSPDHFTTMPDWFAPYFWMATSLVHLSGGVVANFPWQTAEIPHGFFF